MSKTTSFDALWRLGRRSGAAALAAPLLLAAACSSGGSDAAPTTAVPTTAATTTTEVSVEAVGKEFQSLIEDANDAIAAEDEARVAFAEDDDLDGAIDSAAGLQADIEDFQAGLADLDVPAEADDAFGGLEDATDAYVDTLAGYEDVTDVDAYNEQYDAEIAADGDWRDAVAEVADALEVDGLEGSGSTGSDTSSEDTSSDDTSSDEAESSSASSAGLITGDGSEYCLQDGDLPDSFLPLTGKDNRSNAMSYTFDEGELADYADALEASWMVLPEGGAGLEDRTADCLIHIFDSVESAEGFYDAWTSDYGANSMPVPEQAAVADDAPGEDPQAYTVLVVDRPNATEVFRYANVVVSVGISATPDDDMDSTLAATNELAKAVYDRLESAG